VDEDRKTLYRIPSAIAEEALPYRNVVINIITAMSDGVMLIDQKGEIVLVNPALSDVLGLPAQRMIGSGWAELFFDSPANQDFNEIILEVIQGRLKRHNRQVSYVTPSGEPKELLITATVMTADSGADRITGVLLVLNDITPVVRLHKEQRELLLRSKRLYQEKMEGLDRLARAVAHEIRNPVTTIGGLAQRLFHDQDRSSRECQYLRRILDCTNQLETLVRDVRAYADMPPPHLRSLDLGAWLGQLAQDFALKLKAKSARVKMTLAGSVGRPGEVLAEVDEDQLRQVMLMMLENALDAMPEGGDLRLELGASDNTAAISLSDTGKGIDPEDMPYLFDPFFTTKAESSGMGLAIAKRVAVEHEGDLTARPRPEGGTTFTLTIPQKHQPGLEQTPGVTRPPSLR